MYYVSQSIGTVQAMQFGSTNAQASAAIIMQQARVHAESHNGEFPEHAAQLIAAGKVGPDAFAVTESSTQTFNVPLGTSNLQSVGWSPVHVQEEIVREVVAAMPPNVVAHRLGDYVLCWHGIELGHAEASLWLFIVSADPDFNDPTDLNGAVIVGLADGTIERVEIDAWDERLTAQNTLRIANNLAPLPHPSRVRHANPYIAPPSVHED